jgi:hypothetical protein
MALEVAWSWGKGATGDWSASCPVGPYRLVVRTWTWGGLVTPLALAAGAIAPWIDPDALGRARRLRWWRRR